MLGYIEYKEHRDKLINNAKSFQQLSIGLSYVENIFNIENRLKRYKYTHGDLTKDELFEFFNISEGSLLIGGEIHSIVDGIFKKVNEIELFKVMDRIQIIINKRNHE